MFPVFNCTPRGSTHGLSAESPCVDREGLEGRGLAEQTMEGSGAGRGVTTEGSVLVATRAEDFKRTWPGVIQGVRKGPAKMCYAPELKRLAAEVRGRGGLVSCSWALRVDKCVAW